MDKDTLPPYASLRRAFLVGLSSMEWIVICLCIGLVLSAEAVNSAIEALADRVSPAYDEAIKRTKDLAAGAVLLLAIASAVVGLIIFLPKLTPVVAEKTDFYTICSDSFFICLRPGNRSSGTKGCTHIRRCRDFSSVAGVTAVLLQKDWQGLKQGVFSGVTTLGVTYALKYIVKKERPDRSDNHSFPSMHTSTSFAAAAFIQRRYGWKWGLPSYILSTYVG